MVAGDARGEIFGVGAAVNNRANNTVIRPLLLRRAAILAEELRVLGALLRRPCHPLRDGRVVRYSALVPPWLSLI